MHYSLKRATLWNISGYIYLIIASLIATPILIQYLGIGHFAQYGLIVATISLVSAINLGLPQAVTRALSREHAYLPRRISIWATSSQLFVVTGIVAATIATVITYFYHVSYVALAYIFAIVLLNNLVAHYTTLPHAQGHFGYYNAKTYIVGTGNTLLAAYLAYRGHGIEEILSAQLFTYFLTLIVLAYFSLKFFPRPWEGRASKKVAKELVSFGVKNQIGTIIGQVEGQYAKYLLATISPLSLSAFLIAQGLVYKAAGGISQVASALYPASARGGNTSIRPLYYRLQIMIFAVGLMGVAIYHLVGYDFLLWWLHSLEIVTLVDNVISVFVWYLAVLVLTPLSSAILDSHGRPEITSLFAGITTVIEIALSIYLFPTLGIMAPVYGALVAALVTTIPLLLVVERVLVKHA